MSQNYRDVTAIISNSVSIFSLNASLMTEAVNFIFHIMKISNFRHKLAFKQMVRFKSPPVYISKKQAKIKGIQPGNAIITDNIATHSSIKRDNVIAVYTRELF